MFHILVFEVTWLHKGQEIQQTESTHMMVAPDGVVSLHIDKARQEDAGDYTVRVSNPVGMTEKTVRLKVTGKLILFFTKNYLLIKSKCVQRLVRLD